MVQPDGYKLFTDPFFVEKVHEIVGLYLSPLENAVVLCIDEKTQIQAQDRTQPLLPMGLDYVEGVKHDYILHGTTTLFAALDVATGAVIAECKPRHRHQECLSFLWRIDKELPKELDLHLIVYNYCTHKRVKVKVWCPGSRPLAGRLDANFLLNLIVVRTSRRTPQFAVSAKIPLGGWVYRLQAGDFQESCHSLAATQAA